MIFTVSRRWVYEMSRERGKLHTSIGRRAQLLNKIKASLINGEKRHAQ